MSATLPTISVIVPTRNRPSDMQRTLDSLSRVEYPQWELLVVDQSDDTTTQTLVESFAERLPNLRYRSLRLKGVSRARNAGIAETKGEIIALLDDDCTVGSDWLIQVAEAFARHPKADMVLGELRPANGLPEWSEDGWTPARLFPVEVEVRAKGNLRQHLRMWPHFMGNGACMFMRRELAQRIGPFDVHFGPVGHFQTAEDGDYIYRTYMAGCSVVCTPAIVAAHHGLRDYSSGAASRLIRAYQYGIAAYFMKALRSGDPIALVWILYEIWGALGRINVKNILLRRGPSGLLPLSTFVSGLARSFMLRIDHERHLHVARTIRL